MNSNEHTDPIGDQNVERLVAEAYAPEVPDADFVKRVGNRVQEESRQSHSDAESQPVELPNDTDARNIQWELVPWLAAALLLFFIVYLFFPKSQTHDSPGHYREGDIVWIDDKAYIAVDSSDEGSGRSLKPIEKTPMPADSEVRQVNLVGDEGLIPRSRQTNENVAPSEVGESIVTKQGERRRITLPDGSTLFINDQSTVSIDGTRTLTLKRGQVYVEVAADPNLKFVVKTSKRDVTALGTKFAVQVADSNSAVLVTQGKVKVSGVESEVRAGQQLSFNDQETEASQPKVTSAARASHLLSWTKQLMAAAESPLVPGSKHAGGSLIAVDPHGQEAKLSLRKYHVDVHIQDGFARTTIDQTYFNDQSWRMEGTFYFPLPPDASISRLAMYVNGNLMEGGMCERDRARDVFETIKHRALDPALLEWVDGSTFKMRVFPLEGRQEKRIVLSYTQQLENHYGEMQYRFPAGHSMDKVRDWSAGIRVTNGEAFQWECNSHELEKSTDGRDLLLKTAGQDVGFNHDIVITLSEVADRESSARFSLVNHDDSRYLMVRYRPQLEVKPHNQRRDWIFLFDSDGSRDPLLARVQIDVIRTMLENAEHEDRFAIVTAGTRIHAFASELKSASPENIADAIKMLDQTHLIGALDLEKAFKACIAFAKATNDATLVHVGAGVPILGERRTHALLKKLPNNTQYVGVGVGKRWNREFMRAAASETEGYFTQINPDKSVTWRAFDLMSTLNTPRMLDLRVEVDGKACEFFTFKESAVHGEEICAIARLKADQELPKSVQIRGRLDGDPFDRTIKVDEVQDDAEYLPRQWAKLTIDDMVAENAEKHKTEIIELSKSMYVMSPFTSLLVLENDEMYEQYNVDRGRKDHWALYPCPEKIEVIHEPLVGPHRDPPEESKETKPSPREVLGTLLVRVPGFGNSYVTPVHLHGLLPANSYTYEFVPDGGTVLLGGIRLANDDDSVFLDFARYVDGTATTTSVSEVIERRLRAIRLLNSNGDEDFRRYLYLDLADDLPTTEEVQQYLWNVDNDGDGITDFDGLIDLIVSNVTPETWDEVGGPGSIDGFEANLSLVIGQTQEVHHRISQVMAWHDRRVDAPFSEPTARWPMLVDALSSGDLSGIPFDSRPPLVFPRSETWEALADRRLKYRSFDSSTPRSEHEKLSLKLLETTNGEFNKLPLQDVLDYIEDRHDISIELDHIALDDLGIDSDTPITFSFTEISLRSALTLILHELGLSFAITDDALVVTTPDAIADYWQSDRTANEEMLLPIHGGSEFSGWIKGRDLSRRTHPTLLAFNDPRLTGRWAQRLTRRLEQGLEQPSLLYFTPTIGNDQRPFRHLLTFAPGMNTTRSDVLSVLDEESELKKRPVVGKVDPRASRLIQAAHSRSWQSVTWKDRNGRELLTLQVDGRGRYRMERKTEHGLHEIIVCDSDTLTHSYPELGIGARRTMSRFHRADLMSLVPWHVPAADDLSIGADLRLVGPHTVAIVPHDLSQAKDEDGEPIRYSRVHLVFSDDGRLAERRLVEMPGGKTLARITYSEDGTVRVLDAEDKMQNEIQLAAKESAAPSLVLNLDESVVFPMPVRSSSHVIQTVNDAKAVVGGDQNGDVLEQIIHGIKDESYWSEEDALRLVAANHWQDPDEMQDVIAKRFFANGDRRLGFYTLLLSSGWHWDPEEVVELDDGTSVKMDPRVDHPTHPLAQYVASQLELRNDWPRVVPTAIDSPENSFIDRLAQYRRLYVQWSRLRKTTKDAEQLRRDLDELFAFVNECDSPTFAFTLLRRVQHHLGAKQPHGRIADALLRFEKQGLTSYIVQYELARSLAEAGKQDQARQLFLRLYRETFAQGTLPPINLAFVEAIQETDGPNDSNPFDTERTYTGDFDNLMKKTCAMLIEQGRRPTAIALVWQCQQLEQADLADQLLEQMLTGVPEHERIGTTLAAIEYLLHNEQLSRAEELLKPLLQDDPIASSSELWRLAAQIADNGEMLARSLHYRQRAVELEFKQFDSTVNLDWVRSEYGELLDRYSNLADAVAKPESAAADELVVDIVRTADQWRKLDNEVTAACNHAARILNKLGQKELAWDYLTTPLSLKPNEAAPWLNLAETLRDDDEFDLADRAYAAAFAAEPTNAEILWDHAQMLDQRGQSQRALQLYDQIAGHEWQPRFSSVRHQAKAIIESQ